MWVNSFMQGVVQFTNVDEFVEKANELTEDFYNSRIDFIEENLIIQTEPKEGTKINSNDKIIIYEYNQLRET